MARHGENIRKRKDGRWEARLICGYQENGRAKYKSIYGKSYLEVRRAKRALDAAGMQADAGMDMSASTFGCLLDQWLVSVRYQVKESTYSRYVFLADRHIRPELGKLRLTKMTNTVIERFASRKLKQGRLDGKGGLSPRTVSSILSVIRLAIAYGESQNCAFVKGLEVKRLKHPFVQIQVLTEEEQQKLESVIMANPDCIRLGVLLSLYTGLRIGEICALRWEDVDQDEQAIYVQRTLMRIQNTEESSQARTRLVIDKPKSECSVRTIPLPSFLAQILEMNRRNGRDYVLTGTEQYLEPRRYYSKYKKILDLCGLQRFTYHSLRHTFATRCVENGFDIKSLSEILGHANVSTTLQRYVHPSMSLKRKHMEQLEKISICGHYSGQERGMHK